MRLITIEVKYGIMRLHEGRKPRSRLMWRCDGIEFFVLGPLKGIDYGTAANLAMNVCVSNHIPVITLRRVSK